MRTSFLPGLALWSLFPRPQSHGPTFWTVFYGKRLVNALIVQVRISTQLSPWAGTVRNLSGYHKSGPSPQQGPPCCFFVRYFLFRSNASIEPFSRAFRYQYGFCVATSPSNTGS